MTTKTNPLDAFKLPEVLYFASGSNRAAWAKGLTRAGVPMGVAAPEVVSTRHEGDALDPESFRPGVLEAMADNPYLPVFIDSGAFSEVTFPKAGPPVVVKPMTDADWRRVFALYLRVAWRAVPGALSVVAPDRVGDQTVTLMRISQYAPELANLNDLCARVLFPVQRGPIGLASFYRSACAIVGFDMVPAIPLKKAATSLEDLAAFLTEIQPARVHLLGIGPRSRTFAKVLRTIRETSPATVVQCDSVCLRAMVGRTNGPKGGPRALTAALDAVRDASPGLSPTERGARAVASLASSTVPADSAAASLNESPIETEWDFRVRCAIGA